MSADDRVRADSVPIRPAATIMLLRNGPGGLEVFMLQRHLAATFARGNYVFPGGRVDDADHGDAFEPICDGLDDAAASEGLGLDHGGLAWLVAAIRECFEEAGVLLARPTGSDSIVAFDDVAVEQRFAAAREAVNAGRLSFVELCSAEALQLLTDRVHFVDHWITPVGERRRFDTRFFVTAAPAAQIPLHDGAETIASRWVRPGEALTMWRSGELMMFPPTVASLEQLDSFGSAEAALAWAASVPCPAPKLPRVVVDANGTFTRIIQADEPGYHDTPIPDHVLEFVR